MRSCFAACAAAELCRKSTRNIAENKLLRVCVHYISTACRNARIGKFFREWVFVAFITTFVFFVLMKKALVIRDVDYTAGTV